VSALLGRELCYNFRVREHKPINTSIFDFPTLIRRTVNDVRCESAVCERTHVGLNVILK